MRKAWMPRAMSCIHNEFCRSSRAEQGIVIYDSTPFSYRLSSSLRHGLCDRLESVPDSIGGRVLYGHCMFVML